MKFVTEDMNDIKWMSNPEKYPNVASEVRRIMDAGKWEEFLSIHQDDDTGCVDADALYEYLWHEGESALLDVGLHENQATATVEDVLKAWEEENKPLKVSRCENGAPSGLDIYHGGCYGSSLDFESVDENGEIESVSLDDDDVFDLLRYRVFCANNATKGEWDSDDPDTAVFEMWRDRR